MSHRVFGFAVVLAISTGALLTAIGCGGKAGPPPPTTHAAGGVVLGPNGQPLNGGLVEFRHLTNSSLTITGEIGPDGKFSLVTLAQGNRVDGAVPGEYQATVIPIPEETGQIQANVTPITLPETYEITAAGPNQFTFDLSTIQSAATQ